MPVERGCRAMEVKVFIEFKVKAEKRDDFMALVPELERQAARLRAKQFRLYEGTDQPLLFVEEFFVGDIAQYRAIKEQRLDANSPFWSRLHDCVEGGANKLHIWAFQPLT